MKNTVYYLEDKGVFSPQVNDIGVPNENETLVEFLFCGVCGSDYSQFLGLRKRFPVSLGHEFIARVIAVGSGVTNIEPGDYVVSDFNYRCNQCVFCKQEKTHLCVDNNIEAFSNRGFAYYALINFEYLTVVNNISNLMRGTLVEPLSCVIHAKNHTKIEKDNLVLLYGTGNIGTLTAFYLHDVLHMENVYVCDCISEKQNNIVNRFNCKPHEKKLKYDIVFEATNSLSGLLSALSEAKYATKMCSMSHLYGIDTSEAFDYIYKNEIAIGFPLRNGEKTNLKLAANLISNLWDASYDDIFEVGTLKNINELFTSKHSSIYNKQIVSISC